MHQSKRRENIDEAVRALNGILTPGLLGQYTWFEAVEIIAFSSAERGGKVSTRNIFSIYVAEQGEIPPAPRSIFLDEKSKKLKGFDGWRFRVTRRPVAITEVMKSLECYGRLGTWAPPGQDALEVGSLVATPPAFCPPDSRNGVPLNGVLKNNFWSGCYVVELKDDSKSVLGDLARKDSLLSELSEWLTTMVPLNLARVPDRVGDILFQVPANALVAEFRQRTGAGVDIGLAWNPQVEERAVLVELRVEHDGLITSISRLDLQQGMWTVDTPEATGDLQFSVWDMKNELLLAATTTLPSYGKNRRVLSRTSIGRDEPRRFRVAGPNGNFETHEICLVEPSGGWRRDRQPPVSEEVDWAATRALKAKMKQLVTSRKFLQYGHHGTTKEQECLRALEDIRALIRNVSQGAVYLWDPYLSASDLLNTLAFCADAGTDLRGLTSPKPSKQNKRNKKEDDSDPQADEEDAEDESNREKWIMVQRTTLNEAFIGPPCLRLEFRMSWGTQGSFHDRFLIFPGLGLGRTRVWSLGASINHIGAQHCIVQEVAYPEPVLQAFQGFWDQSSQPKHLIWKYS